MSEDKRQGVMFDSATHRARRVTVANERFALIRAVATTQSTARLVTFDLGLEPRVGEPHRVTIGVGLMIQIDQLGEDESGEHPGQLFGRLVLTREQLRALADEADDEFEEHLRACGTDRFGRRR